MPLVYRELHHIAQRCMAGERAGHSLQATALVNEAYLRLVDANDVAWHDRAHFLAVAARAMRRILVDHARVERAQKRGGNATRVTFDEALVVADKPQEDFAALDDALTALTAFDERKGRVVELRFFGGLSLPDVARLLDSPLRTVERDWQWARTWLRANLE